MAATAADAWGDAHAGLAAEMAAAIRREGGAVGKCVAGHIRLPLRLTVYKPRVRLRLVGVAQAKRIYVASVASVQSAAATRSIGFQYDERLCCSCVLCVLLLCAVTVDIRDSALRSAVLPGIS